jgi:hypothetical protein
VLLDIPNGDVTEELADDILDTTEPARKAGVEVSVGGNLGGVLSKSPTESSEVVGLLTLFGRAVWWLPGWLARLLPHVDIEGESEAPPPPPAPAPQPQAATAGPAPPAANGPSAGPPAGQATPPTDTWPKPSTRIHETTHPTDGNGRVERVPDE